MKSKKLAIIGGGAAGMFCAANLVDSVKNRNLEVTIFDRLDSPLQKLLATGGGRCNITNLKLDIKELSSNFPRGEKFLYSVFSVFNPQDTINWFEKRGIKLHKEENNCIFPDSNKAESVAKCLLHAVKHSGYTIITSSYITGIEMDNTDFSIKTENCTEKFDLVLLSTGGHKSIKEKVRDYNGYELAKMLKHNIIKPVLALRPFDCMDKSLSLLSGVTLNNISTGIKYKNKTIASIKGDILITHTGLSGPAIHNLSSLILRKLDNENDEFSVIINLTRFREIFDTEKDLIKHLEQNLNKSMINIISDYCPRSMAKHILTEKKIDPEKKANSLTKLERKELAKSLTEFEITAKLNTKTGMVTAGGINLKEVNSKTMESRLTKGLYFAGEILDIDGLSGGYNLQLAWSTAYIAAKSIESNL